MSYVADPDRYQKLPYRRAGANGLDMPAFSLGLWQKFGFDYPFETQREIILHAFDLGITHFDIANRYGPPFRAAERLFGRLLRTDLAPNREEIMVSSKAGGFLGDSSHLQGASRKSLLTSLDHSLRDLGVDYVEIFYSHRPDETVPLAQGLLTDKYLEGKIPPGARAAGSPFLSPDLITDEYIERAVALNQDAPQLTDEELALVDEHGVHGTGIRV